MEDFGKTIHIPDAETSERANQLIEAGKKNLNLRLVLTAAMGHIDLTTLEGADTDEKVASLCRKGLDVEKLGLGLPSVAAICVYPTLVKIARKTLEGSKIKTAAVAGAFPAGQSPIHVKIQEVKYTVDEGAQEIDMVISRGKFLQGEYNLVFDEIAAIKEACGDAQLKVILETGELPSATLIRRASEIAIKAGGDFIKTSTGKIPGVANPLSVLVMLEAIKDHYEATGKMVGIKPSGGIANAETAINYYVLTSEVLGNEWLNSNMLRFGASRLVDAIISEVKGVKETNVSAQNSSY